MRCNRLMAMSDALLTSCPLPRILDFICAFSHNSYVFWAFAVRFQSSKAALPTQTTIADFHANFSTGFSTRAAISKASSAAPRRSSTSSCSLSVSTSSVLEPPPQSCRSRTPTRQGRSRPRSAASTAASCLLASSFFILVLLPCIPCLAISCSTSLDRVAMAFARKF